MCTSLLRIVFGLKMKYKLDILVDLIEFELFDHILDNNILLDKQLL